MVSARCKHRCITAEKELAEIYVIHVIISNDGQCSKLKASLLGNSHWPHGKGYGVDIKTDVAQKSVAETTQQPSV